MTVLAGPVCDAGRCAQLLKALAEAKLRAQAGLADQVRAVLDAVRDDPRLALTDGQRAVWPVVVVDAVASATGVAPDHGQVAA